MPIVSKPEEALTYDTLSVMTDRLKVLATRREDLWWDIGCLLDAMATRGFAGNVGVRDYASYAHKVVGIERAEARRLRRVAQLFSREVAVRFGLEKLELLLQLIDALQDAPPVVDPMRIEVFSHKGDGAVQAIPFSESTVEDLRFTIRALSGRSTSGDPRFGPGLGELRDKLENALKRTLARKAPRVRIERDPANPRAGLALCGVSPETLEAVGRVLIAQARASSRSSRPSRPPRRKTSSAGARPTARKR